MGEEAKALQLFTEATKAVHNTALNDASIEVFGRAAIRAIDAALKENAMEQALDTMQKTKAIEDYVISQIDRQRIELAEVNRLIAFRFQILRKIGWWLDENIDKHPGVSSDMVTHSEKPKFYLEDLGITKKQSMWWQRMARMSDEEFDAFIEPYLQVDTEDREQLLSLNKLLNFLAPDDPEDAEGEEEVDEVPDIKLTPSGDVIYGDIKDIEGELQEWVSVIETIPMRELIFLGKVLNENHSFIGGVMKRILKELEARGVQI